MEKTIIHEINGTKYLLFEIRLPIKNAPSFNRKIKSVNGILQSVKSNHSFWNGTMLNIKYLIPEEIAFKNAQYQFN
jgi:hypothetical protein